VTEFSSVAHEDASDFPIIRLGCWVRCSRKLCAAVEITE